ncbi:MAG: helix-turn-helix domain-containing protein [Alphaproteobacteria bacterium]|jgi:hypothetical protein|nr:helix-turn-helix domain-containing protein [Alphaproteobacteria bacterium]
MSDDKKSYTPKEVEYITNIGYRTVLADIKNKKLIATKEKLSYKIYEDDLANYLANKNNTDKELVISFKGNIPNTKLKEITEELIETFNTIKEKHNIYLSLNIETK